MASIIKPDLDQAIYTPSEVSDIGLKNIQAIQANAPRSVGLDIVGIKDYLVPVPPGRMGVVIAQTSNYKTGLLNFMVYTTAEQLNKQKRFDECIIHISTEDLIEEQAISELARVAKVDSAMISRGEILEWGGLFKAAIMIADIPVYRIGESLTRALRPDAAPRLYLSNINRTIERMRELYNLKPALVVLDYLQALPIDPEITHGAKVNEQRRLQVRDDIYQIRRGAAFFDCPWWVGVQAKQHLEGAPSPKMYIPGIYDGEECVAGDNLIVDMHTGIIKSAKEWFESGQPLSVHSLASDNQLSAADTHKIQESGVTDIFKVEGRGGWEARVTANHKFLTSAGWKCTTELALGDWLAVARRMELHLLDSGLSLRRAQVLGLLLGNGSYTNGEAPAYACGTDKPLGDLVSQMISEEFGVRGAMREHYIKDRLYWELKFYGDSSRPGSNNLITWLREIGLYGQKHNDASVPEVVMTSSDACVAGFLCGLFSTDGSFLNDVSHSPLISYATASPIMARQVRLLLLRLGIPSGMRVQRKRNLRHHDMHCINISGMAHIRRFMEVVGFLGGNKKISTDLAYQTFRDNSPVSGRLDVFPPEVALMALNRLQLSHITEKVSVRAYKIKDGRGISRELLESVGELTGDEELLSMAGGDVGWVRLESVTSDGCEMSYDLSIEETHNFVLNGLLTHNSSAIGQRTDRAICQWMPKTMFAAGKVVEYGETSYTVSDDLIFIRVAKQRGGFAAGRTWKCHIDFINNRIVPELPSGDDRISGRGESEYPDDELSSEMPEDQEMY